MAPVIVPGDRNLSIVLLTSNLEGGGTERQVITLARELVSRNHIVRLVVRREGGHFFEEAKQGGLDVVVLGGKPRQFMARLVKFLRRVNPDVLYSFLPESNVYSSIAKLFVPRLCVVHGVRSSKFDLKAFPVRTRLAYAISTFVTPIANGVVFNSVAGRESYSWVRRLARSSAVISNGIDVQRFHPDLSARSAWREKRQIDDRVLVIGVVGRVDPLKGLPVLFDSLRSLDRQGVNFCCVLFGAKSESDFVLLRRLAHSHGLRDKIELEAFTNEPERVFQAVDLVVVPSISEGFPNAVAEALLCGAHVATTDVGDTRRIVGESYPLARPSDSQSLAQVITSLAGRQVEPTQVERVRSAYSIEKLADRTISYMRGLRGLDA